MMRESRERGDTAMNGKLLLAATAAALTLAHASSARAQYVVQIPVDSVLNGRSVSTLTGGVVVPFTPNEGVYSNGANGYATAAVKMQLANTTPGVGLPDDGLFPAAAPLPAFQLHFSNAAPATSPQTHYIPAGAAAPTFQFAVPPAIYSALYLIFTCSEGSATFTVTLSYSGGTPNDVSKPITIPDTGIGVQTGGSPHFYIITNTGKWTATAEAEHGGHTIEGIQLTPSTTAMLTGVQVTRTSTSYLVFWGATGIATTPVDGGTEPPSDSGVGGGGPEGGGEPLDASTGSTSGATSGAATSSGTGSGASSTGVASAGTTSGATTSGVTTGSTTAGSGTTSSGASGAAAPSGSSVASSGSSATTSPSSGSSSSGCSFAPSAGTGACWISLAALGWFARARRRPRGRKAVARKRRSAP
jgi:hypothetical protein